MSHQTEAFGRAPDEQATYSRGQVELTWAHGDRGVSLFYSKNKRGEESVELCLKIRIFVDGEPDWMTSGDGVFDGKDEVARKQAWAWLSGGPWPTAKAL